MDDRQYEKKHDPSIPLYLLYRYDRVVEHLKRSGYDLSKIKLTREPRANGKI